LTPENAILDGGNEILGKYLIWICFRNAALCLAGRISEA
jgi:hypothetical protein